MNQSSSNVSQNSTKMTSIEKMVPELPQLQSNSANLSQSFQDFSIKRKQLETMEANLRGRI